MFKQFRDELVSRVEEMVQIRRYLHQYPELSFHEEKTAKYIADFYQGKDCQVETGVGGHGIVVTINTSNPGKTIAFRADFDALPIQEETDLPFKSTIDGVMHACGHDAHTAQMMIFADTVIKFKDQLKGTIRIIHQHAEEVPPGGAISMIQAGCLDNVDEFYSLHLISTMPFGSVFYRARETQAGRASFRIKLTGLGSHGSEPHNGNDAIVAASHLVIQLQNIVSRRVRPGEMAVVTVGSFDGIGAPNIIKETVELQGDVRYMKSEIGQLVQNEFKNISEGIKNSFNVDVDLFYENDYPVLYNNPELTETVKNALETNQEHIPFLEHIIETPQLSSSEDAAYYLQKVKGSYFYVGASPEKVYPHHNPKFDIKEESMLTAASCLAAILVVQSQK